VIEGHRKWHDVERARRAACDFSVGRYTTNRKSDFSSQVLTFSCIRHCYYLYCTRLPLFCRISTPYISNLIRVDTQKRNTKDIQIPQVLWRTSNVVKVNVHLSNSGDKTRYTIRPKKLWKWYLHGDITMVYNIHLLLEVSRRRLFWKPNLKMPSPYPARPTIGDNASLLFGYNIFKTILEKKQHR
jgi:hypothetical protein